MAKVAEMTADTKAWRVIPTDMLDEFADDFVENGLKRDPTLIEPIRCGRSRPTAPAKRSSTGWRTAPARAWTRATSRTAATCCANLQHAEVGAVPRRGTEGGR